MHFYQRPNLSETLQIDLDSVLLTRCNAALETLEPEVYPLVHVQPSDAAEDELSSMIEASIPRLTLPLFEPVLEFCSEALIIFGIHEDIIVFIKFGYFMGISRVSSI
jgi:hypothetical protein